LAKKQRSVGLSLDLIRFIEDNRGAFSFSAYVEYLCWEGIRSLIGEKTEEKKDVEPRRTLIRVR